jgi:hypothetical protein
MVSVMRERLQKRRELLEKRVLPKLPEPVRYSAPLDADLSDADSVGDLALLIDVPQRTLVVARITNGLWVVTNDCEGLAFNFLIKPCCQ